MSQQVSGRGSEHVTVRVNKKEVDQQVSSVQMSEGVEKQS